MTTPQTITVDGVEYTRKTSTGPWSYAVVKGGWIFVGKLQEHSEDLSIKEAYVVRYHRGGGGLGDIATKNKLKLDCVNSDCLIPRSEVTLIAKLPDGWSPLDA